MTRSAGPSRPSWRTWERGEFHGNQYSGGKGKIAHTAVEPAVTRRRRPARPGNRGRRRACASRCGRRR